MVVGGGRGTGYGQARGGRDTGLRAGQGWAGHWTTGGPGVGRSRAGRPRAGRPRVGGPLDIKDTAKILMPVHEKERTREMIYSIMLIRWSRGRRVGRARGQALEWGGGLDACNERGP